MPYDQLARLFPDGKTVHIASNGQTLPGYEQARIELAERGETDLPPAQESGGFFAWLFGGGSNTTSAAREDEEDRRAPAAAPVATAPVATASVETAPAAVASAAPEPQADPRAVMAYAEPDAARVSPVVAELAQSQADGSPQGGAPAGPQVASLGQPDDVLLPMPPRRPLELARVADIPLPPIRPTALAGPQAELRFASTGVPLPPVLHRDPIGGLITATASGVPMLRRSRLPALITQGTGDRARLPDQALAFAGDAVASDRVPKFRLASVSKARLIATPMRRVASVDDVPIMSGPRLTGLRSAAHALVANPSQL